MHFYDQITQYRDNGLVFTKISQYEEGDPGAFCSAIYTVIIKGASFYLPISNGTYSTKDASQSISVLTIHNHQLIDTVRLFKTRKGLLNTINVNFDFFSVVDRPERPLPLITYDDNQKVIRIPLVKDDGQLPDKTCCINCRTVVLDLLDWNDPFYLLINGIFISSNSPKSCGGKFGAPMPSPESKALKISAESR
jgi:hypothetical protein